MATKYLTR